MKELETHLKTGNNRESVELSIKKQKEVQKILQGTIKPRIGHFVWEINEETGEIKKAEFKRTVAVLGAKVPVEELITKVGCICIPALNAQNAKRKYLKNKEQSAYYTQQPIGNLSDLNFK